MKDVHNTDPSHLMTSLSSNSSMKDNQQSTGSIIVGGKPGTNQEIIIPANKSTTFLTPSEFQKFAGSGSFQIVNVNGDTPTMQIITAVDNGHREGEVTIDEDGRIITEGGQQLEVPD